MLKKTLILIGWLLGCLCLATGCWMIGLWWQWPLWKSALLLVAVIIGLFLVRGLFRRCRAWRLRRQLSRPVKGDTPGTRRLDSDWRAGLQALKQSRLSRFGSPLYVLPWYLALGVDETETASLLQQAVTTAPIHGKGDDPPLLRWWLLPHCVVLTPSDALNPQHTPRDVAQVYWRRLLFWMMHTRRREPLNGLIVPVDVTWLMDSEDASLRDTGLRLREKLDELTRLYNARIPVHFVLTGAERLPGFTLWASSLGQTLNQQAMGYLDTSSHLTVGQFISDAFNSIVHRMFDLRILNGITDCPDALVFGLPERITPLADRLGIMLHPAFQATPYTETPLLRSLSFTARPHSADSTQPAWFSTGIFNQLLPAQRHTWQPLERWRHWRRLLRHAAVVTWLLVSSGVGALLLYSGHAADQQLQAIHPASTGAPRDFSGTISADLYALQTLRESIHHLQDPAHPAWQWLPFRRRVEQARQALTNAYTQEFHREIVVENLDPLLLTSLPRTANHNNDRLLAAWVQMLVRRINLINAALQGSDVYAEPAPGSEIPLLLSQTKGAPPSLVDGVMLGSMYQDYLAWQPDRQILVSERQALEHALMSLNLGNRPLDWLNHWVDLQGNIAPVRLSDFWDISPQPDQPYVPAAFTLEGERAIAGFVNEIQDATNNSARWQARRDELRSRHQRAGLAAWHTFAAAFTLAPEALRDNAVRRTALSSLFSPADPYARLLHLLADTGRSISASARPAWIRLAIQLDGLMTLAQHQPSASAGMAATLRQHVDVVQQFGGRLLRHMPADDTLDTGFSDLKTDQKSATLLTNYRSGILDTITPLLQGQGNALKAASDIWSFGHDPNVKSPPLIDASKALQTLRQGTPSAQDPQSNVIWQLLAGPMNFTLDYAGRSVACTLQQTWENTVLSVDQGLHNAELANSLLFGTRGHMTHFLAGSIKHFIDQTDQRYHPRRALGHVVPLNGQFYAFANMAQLQHITLASDAVQTTRNQQQRHALTQQQTDIDNTLTALQATTANVTLSIIPTQTNPQAHQLPDSVTLSLQCANGRLTLENLNFPNKQVFPWSRAHCGDTTLTIRYASFTLTRQWSGATGFIAFLREFSSGQRRYTPADFSDQAAALQQAGVRWITVGYLQQGQTDLLAAFARADELAAQSERLQKALTTLQTGPEASSTTTTAANVPTHITTRCSDNRLAPRVDAGATGREMPH